MSHFQDKYLKQFNDEERQRFPDFYSIEDDEQEVSQYFDKLKIQKLNVRAAAITLNLNMCA